MEVRRDVTHCDLLLTGGRLATLCNGAGDYGVIEDGSLAIADGKIVAVGTSQSLAGMSAVRAEPLDGRWLTPGLIDCHTHVVFAGNRAGEFEERLAGASYEAIAAAGGGILSTVRATRDAGEEGLVAASRPRLAALLREGVTTIEIKSGYGLETATEMRMLSAARALGSEFGITVRTSFLGAHALPADAAGGRRGYLRRVIDDMLPAIHAAGLADAVDAYCEGIAFSASELAPLFDRARDLGLPVRLHADQLSACGGAALAARYRALSADHLEYSSDDDIAALAQAGSTAVLLPGAFLTLRERQAPPVDALRRHGVPLAIASDCNPGTSPHCSLRAAMHLATALFRLTPAECLAAVTRNAARALGLADRGTLEVGKRADLLVWDIEHPAELSYWLGLHQPRARYVAGRLLDSPG